MATDLDIRMKVDSSQIDQAVQKLGQIKDLGKGLSIQYDINNKPLEVVIDQSVNLQKQLRLVTQELKRTKEGTAEFALLAKTQGDIQDALARTKTKSGDLFTSLQLLPGPVGEFASKLNGAIALLKTFSSFSLSDLRFQLGETVGDLKDIVSGFLGVGDAAKTAGKAVGEATGTAAGSIAGTAVGAGAGAGIGAAGGAAAASAAAIAVQEVNIANMTGAVDLANKAVANLGKNFDAQVDILKNAKGAITDVVVSYVTLNGEQDLLTASQIKNIAASEVQIVTTEQLAITETKAVLATEALVVAETEATAATGLFATALTALQAIFTGGIWLAFIAVIGAIVAGFYQLMPLLFNYTRETKENTSATDAFTEALKREKAALDADLTAIDQNLKARQTRAKILGKDEEQLAKLTIKAGEDKLEALRSQDKLLFQEQDALRKRKDLTNEQSAKLNKDINDRLLENNKSIINQIMANEQTRLDEELRVADKRRQELKSSGDKINSDAKALAQKKIADQKTADQLYLDLIRENAKQAQQTEEEKELFSLEIQRQAEKDKLDDLKISTETKNKIIAQIDIKYEDLKKALNKKYRDDELKARKDALNQLRELSIKSIEDEVVKSRVSRLKQFNDEKEKLDQYLKDGLITREKYNEAIINLQKSFANDIAKINTDARIKELEATKAVDESRLRIFQMNMDQSNATRLGYLEQYFAQQLKVEDDNYKIELERNKNNKKELERVELEHSNNVAAIKEAERRQKFDVYKKGVDDLAGIFAEESDLQKGAIILKQTLLAIELGLEISKTIAFSKLAVARSVLAVKEGTAQTAKIGFPQNVIPLALYAIQAAAIISSIIKAAKAIGPSAGPEAVPTAGKNYGKGGIIEGPLHRSAQGGTPVMAEGGEAIMTRGAVAQFRPLLSAMNQMGGGTAFSGGVTGQAPFDNPATAEKTMEPQIIKTYIVERDLTSTQERQARLKSLSTL